jgi:hypothetical protein
MDLVSVSIKGRLGNNLFQVATGVAYAKRYGKQFLLLRNKGLFPDLPKRDIDSPIFDSLPSGYFKPRQVWIEPSFSYTEIPYLEGNVHLDGYFQSDKYFSDYPVEAFPPILGTAKADTGFIHVRRGDYLLKQDYHPVLGMDYYKDAMLLLEGMYPHLMNRKWYIFSDDLDWCRQNFVGDRFVFMEGTPEECLSIMSGFSYAIIANSSFSWWGSYLANAVTVAPKNWFGPSGPKAHDLYRKDWIVL